MTEILPVSRAGKPELFSRERLKRIKNPWAMRRALWLSTARANQLAPPGDWSYWLNQSGRGNGKTRAGAEYMSNQVRLSPGYRGLVVGRTYRDVRDVIVEGPAGLLKAIPERYVENWNRSLGELRLTNGSRFECFGAEDPDVFRGHEYDGAWLDEAAAYSYADEVFDAMEFTLRMGENPRCIITTTPRPSKFVMDLAANPETVVTYGSMYENPYLSDRAKARLEKKYGGTALGRQELLGEIIKEVVGALWTRDILEGARILQGERPVTLDRVVVALDPAGGGPDEVGIMVVARAGDHFYVLADLSVSGFSPERWGAKAVYGYTDYLADVIVGEGNYGGDMVLSVVRTAAKALEVSVNAQLVTASRGKAIRAEPISALYEQGRVHHVGSFPELEDQMTTWVPGDKKSPDRMDALVWGITELMDTGTLEFT